MIKLYLAVGQSPPFLLLYCKK